MSRSPEIEVGLLSSDRILAHLQNSPLLPQLLQELAIDETIDRVVERYKLDLTFAPEEFDNLAARVAEILPFQGMNADQIAAITTRSLKLQKFKEAGWGSQIEDYFQQVEHRLDRVTYSLLLVDDGALAQELFFRIQAGEQSFAEIALAYSQDATAPSGGLVGPVSMSEIPPTIAQILQQLQPGQLSPLFQIDRYYGTLRLNESLPAQLDEPTRQFLLDRLFEAWLKSELADPNPPQPPLEFPPQFPKQIADLDA